MDHDMRDGEGGLYSRQRTLDSTFQKALHGFCTFEQCFEAYEKDVRAWQKMDPRSLLD